MTRTHLRISGPLLVAWLALGCSSTGGSHGSVGGSGGDEDTGGSTGNTGGSKATGGSGGKATGGSGGSTGGSSGGDTGGAGGSTGGAGGSTGGAGGSTGGAGGAGCSPAGKSCAGDMLQTCGADGKLTTTPCAMGCNGAAIACNLCKPNTRSCNGGSLVICRSDGSGTDTSNCPSGCNSTTGECNSCQPSTSWCNGNILRECTAAGTQRDKETCQFGCNNGRMACNACTPGELRCSASGTALEECRSDGTGWATQSSCGSKGCNGTRRACNACTPGAKTCAGSTLSACRGDGSGYDNSSCADGCRSDGSDCLTCGGGQHACSGVCKSDSSAASCGARCDPCPTVTNGTATCSAGSCGFSCDPGMTKCNPGTSACERTSWSFETGTEGWRSNWATDAADDGNLATGTARAHAGSSALAVPISVSLSKYAMRLDWWPCGRFRFTQDGPEAVNWRNRTFRYWVYLQSSTAPASGHSCYTGYSSRGTAVNLPTGTDIPLNQWTLVQMPMPQAEAADLTFLGIDCRPNSSTSWTGTIYFDDFSIQ